ETPRLSSAAVSGPHLFPFATDYVPEGGGAAQRLFLHTSPEYTMKRLLAAGCGCIWQLSRVYRNGETGSRHNPEFSMPEWYRRGSDHHKLMDVVDDTGVSMLASERPRRVTYAALFEDYLQVDIHTAAEAELARLGRQRCGFQGELDRDGWLNLLFSHCIEPQLLQPTMVYAFPASQAALAQVVTGDDR